MSCEKRCFWDRASAKAFTSRHRNHYGPMRVYKCTDDPNHEMMGMWHTTTQSSVRTAAYRDWKKEK